jgi:hypothetical protein
MGNHTEMGLFKSMQNQQFQQPQGGMGQNDKGTLPSTKDPELEQETHGHILTGQD